MPDLWRISNHRDLSREGGLRYGARWHSAGRRIVYLAESPAGALLETLVHLELLPGNLPPSYTLLRVDVPARLDAPEVLMPPGEGWREDNRVTRELGDRWLRASESALLRVPSVLLPNTWNVLLNPIHADAGRLEIAEAVSARFDMRLLRHLRS